MWKPSVSSLLVALLLSHPDPGGRGGRGQPAEEPWRSPGCTSTCGCSGTSDLNWIFRTPTAFVIPFFRWRAPGGRGGVGRLRQGRFSVHVGLISRHREKDDAVQAVQPPGRSRWRAASLGLRNHKEPRFHLQRSNFLFFFFNNSLLSKSTSAWRQSPDSTFVLTFCLFYLEVEVSAARSSGASLSFFCFQPKEKGKANEDLQRKRVSVLAFMGAPGGKRLVSNQLAGDSVSAPFTTSAPAQQTQRQIGSKCYHE